MHLLIFDQLLKIFQNAANDKQYFDLIYFNNQQLMKSDSKLSELNIACAKERCPLNGHSAADSALDEVSLLDTDSEDSTL
ncbi:hypothetical protein T08_14871 [Trichinella sp. T8]|nr:hypothetical protein T08_14871 [Trichinella sp. T8]